MKKVILFIAAAVVSVATLQAQNLDALRNIVAGLGFEQRASTEADTVEEPIVSEPVEETAPVKENPVVGEVNIADVVRSILPSEFSYDSIATKGEVSALNPVDEIASYVETVNVAETPVVDEVSVTDVVRSILPSEFSYEPIATKGEAYALNPSEQIASYAETATAIKTRFLPMRQRVDRNIGDNKFVYKGEFMLGLTASYGNISTENSDIMLLLNDINIGLRSTTIRPFFAYAYRDNMAVGLRLGYQYINGSLGNINLDLGLLADGMEGINISDLGLRNESFSWALFHRNYLGLDRRGIVGVIIESELLVKTGSTLFTSGGDVVNVSRSSNFAAQLNVNPGLGIYIFPQVCVTATVGIGGLRYNNVRQYDGAGNVIGRRDHSSLNFKVNITDIQIGVVAHLWKNKKK